jgi:hypothetical protein
MSIYLDFRRFEHEVNSGFGADHERYTQSDKRHTYCESK